MNQGQHVPSETVALTKENAGEAIGRPPVTGYLHWPPIAFRSDLPRGWHTSILHE